jgi:acyl-CoA reductase-like NAD-dependent aldehyde dehydrogenase
MGQAEDEAKLRAAGWVEDCGGLWSHSSVGTTNWMPLWLACIFQGTREMSPETRKLAQEAADACARREAELAAMSPEDREKAIDEWARKLAEDVSSLND